MQLNKTNASDSYVDRTKQFYPFSDQHLQNSSKAKLVPNPIRIAEDNALANPNRSGRRMKNGRIKKNNKKDALDSQAKAIMAYPFLQATFKLELNADQRRSFIGTGVIKRIIVLFEDFMVISLSMEVAEEAGISGGARFFKLLAGRDNIRIGELTRDKKPYKIVTVLTSKSRRKCLEIIRTLNKWDGEATESELEHIIEELKSQARYERANPENAADEIFVFDDDEKQPEKKPLS